MLWLIMLYAIIMIEEVRALSQRPSVIYQLNTYRRFVMSYSSAIRSTPLAPQRPILVRLKLPYVLFSLRRHIHGAFQRMPGPGLKVIIFTTNYMPIGQCISIRVKIILVMVYNLPALLVILCGAVCIPPAITVMVPSYLILRLLHQ